jgi:hypothetical protein
MVKASIYEKWQIRHKLMNMVWSHLWLALHEQEEFDSGLSLVEYSRIATTKPVCGGRKNTIVPIGGVYI